MKKAYFLGILLVCVVAMITSSGSVFACTHHSYQQCVGNYLYWYDSCGNQQDSQYCSNGCYNNYCQNYNNYNYNYSNCTYHAYKLCVGSNIYWYDSCGSQQDLFQACFGTNQTCRYGQCVYQQPAPAPVPQYIAHSKLGCYNNNIYWYDSLGRTAGLYKNCSDSNSCTLDGCSSGKCSDVLKCDGSTCQLGSDDYNIYCANNNINPNNNSNNVNNNSNNTVGAGALSISFLVKQSQDSAQWQKTAQVNSDGQVYFMVSVANNSATQVDNISVLANIPSEITSLGNLQINGVQLSGDIVSGVNMGSLAPGVSKSITFEGKTQSIPAQAVKQAAASINVSGSLQSDYVSIDLIPAQAAGAVVSSSVATSGFWTFLKRWYLWILVGLVLIFLFVVVFRRLSSSS